MNAFSPPHPDRIRRIAAVASLAILAGCAAPKSAMLPDLSSWDARTRVLGQLDRWEFGGRIGVRTGDDGFNGKLRYAQDAGAFAATVSGPLGVGTVRIAGDERGVVLTDKDGKQTRLEDVEAELRARYGWTIPVSSLRYWALGIPDPSTPARTEFSDAGLLTHLVQRDWTVDISRYDAGGGQPMPALLTAQNSDTRVRLVIDHWVFFE
ncbi:MAG: lipoprotein insertase outer membrane protein LolB [Woeseiaceae bacterium]